MKYFTLRENIRNALLLQEVWMVLSYLYLFQVEVHSSVFDFTHIFYRENRSFVVGSYLYTFELASSMMIYIDYSSL